MRIASFVISLLALCTCWIPCVGWMAAIPAGIGMLLGLIGCIIAKKGEGKGLGIAGIILGAMALGGGIANFYVTDKAVTELSRGLEQSDADFRTAMDEAVAAFAKAVSEAPDEEDEATESTAEPNLPLPEEALQNAVGEMTTARQKAMDRPSEAEMQKDRQDAEAAALKAPEGAAQD